MSENRSIWVFVNSEIRQLAFGITAYIRAPDNSELIIDFMLTDTFIRPANIIEKMRLADIEDIAAMKLEAITTRNTKRDFYDIAELLKKYKLQQLLKFYKEKYPYHDIKQVLENLTFFSEDCESNFDPDTLKEQDWTSVKFTIIDAFNEYIDKTLNENCE